MTLHEALQAARSEEDVKDAYIKALGLKDYSKNLIDIQTKEIWFEAKGNHRTTYEMFTQLLHYVQVARNKGEHVPPFLCVFDRQKAVIMKTATVLPFLDKKTIRWGKRASDVTRDALDQVSAFIGTHIVAFKIADHAAEFIETVKTAIKTGEIIRTRITPDKVVDKAYDTLSETLGKNWQRDYIVWDMCCGVGNLEVKHSTPDNLWQAAIVFAVRRLIKPTWINDRDQFLQPSEPLTEDFKRDCLIYMLFNGSNLTASADGLQWNGKSWSIVNHFIPFTEEEVGAPARFESDFMVQYLANLAPVIASAEGARQSSPSSSGRHQSGLLRSARNDDAANPVIARSDSDAAIQTFNEEGWIASLRSQ